MYEKESKSSEIKQELREALKEIINSKEANSFNCPFGKVSFEAIAELRKSLDEKKNEIMLLQNTIEELNSKKAKAEKSYAELYQELEAQKRDNLNLNEELRKMEVEENFEEQAYKKLQLETKYYISKLDELLQTREKILGKTLFDVAKQIIKKLNESVEQEGSKLSNLELSREIAQNLYHLYEEYGREPDKRINELREKHNSLMVKIGSNLMIDGRIPMRFLQTANALLTKAEQSSFDQKKELAKGYRDAVEEIDATIDRLIEDPEINKMLQALKGRF